MFATKIGENITSVLHHYFSWKIYTLVRQTNYLHVQKQVYFSHKQYLFGLIFTGRFQEESVSLAKWLSVRLRTKWLWVRVPLQSDQVYYKFFYSAW